MKSSKILMDLKIKDFFETTFDVDKISIIIIKIDIIILLLLIYYSPNYLSEK